MKKYENFPETVEGYIFAWGAFYAISGVWGLSLRVPPFDMIPFESIFLAPLPLLVWAARFDWKNWRKSWTAWQSKLARIVALTTVAIMLPYLAWYVYKPILAKFGWLAHESAIEDMLFLVIGTVLMASARRMTTRVFGPELVR